MARGLSFPSSAHWMREARDAMDGLRENACGDDAVMADLAARLSAVLVAGLETFHHIRRRTPRREGGPS
jgi:hypothetical protein